MAGGNRLDVELMRSIFADDSVHLTVAIVNRVTVAADGSSVAIEGTGAFDARKIVMSLGYDSIGPNSGSGDLPIPGTACVVAFMEGEPQVGIILKFLPSKEETLPTQIRMGHMMHKSKAGKNLYLASDTSVQVGRGTAECTSPLVLGDVMLNCLTDIMNAFLNAAQIGQTAMGPAVLDPSVRLALQEALSKYVTTVSTNIVAQKAFTERGV